MEDGNGKKKRIMTPAGVREVSSQWVSAGEDRAERLGLKQGRPERDSHYVMFPGKGEIVIQERLYTIDEPKLEQYDNLVEDAVRLVMQIYEFTGGDREKVKEAIPVMAVKAKDTLYNLFDGLLKKEKGWLRKNATLREFMALAEAYFSVAGFDEIIEHFQAVRAAWAKRGGP